MTRNKMPLSLIRPGDVMSFIGDRVGIEPQLDVGCCVFDGSGLGLRQHAHDFKATTNSSPHCASNAASFEAACSHSAVRRARSSITALRSRLSCSAAPDFS